MVQFAEANESRLDNLKEQKMRYVKSPAGSNIILTILDH